MGQGVKWNSGFLRSIGWGGLLVGLFLSDLSYAYGVSVTPVFGYSQGISAILPGTNVSTGFQNFNFLLGLLWEGKISSQLALELGFLGAVRGFARKDDGAQSSVSFNTVQAPLLLKWQFIPNLSLGFGGYYSYGYGTYTLENASGSSSLQYGSGNYSATDYGAVMSVSFKLKLISFISGVVDVRYLLGLGNISPKTDNSTYLRDFQFLTGIRIGY